MVKSLRFLKGQLTRAEAKARKANTYNVYSLKHFLDELERDYDEFKEKYSDRELTEAEEQEFIENEEKYEYAQSVFREMIDSKLNRDPNSSFEHSTGSPALSVLLEKQVALCETVGELAKRMSYPQESRLPALRIPQFSGDYRQWNSFKNLFLSRVGNNSRLTNCEKLGHLFTLLTGEAAGLVKHLQLEDVNYAPAWKELEDKYDRPYRIAMDIIGNFKRSMGSEIKSQNVSSFCSTFSETFLALDNLSEYSNERDVWVIHEVVERFDRTLKEKWAAHITGNYEPTVKELKEFLLERAEISVDAVNKFQKSEKDNYRDPKKEQRFRSNTTFIGGCFVCHNDHRIFDCEKFKSLSVSERDRLVKSLKRCFNCLGSNHSVKSCKSSNRCSHCKKMHHSLLHIDRDHIHSEKEHIPSDGNETTTVANLNAINCSFNAGLASALLPTAVVDIVLSDNIRVKCRLLLDSGAQASFVTANFVRKLNLRVVKHRVPVHVMSSESPIYSKGSVQLLLSSRYDSKKKCPVHAYVFERLTGDLPGSDLTLKSGRSLHDRFPLADPEFDKVASVDLIVGADHFFGIVGKGRYHQKLDNLFIIESMFGWLVSGGSHDASRSSLGSSHCAVQSAQFEQMINRFWDLDNMPNQECAKEDDEVCETLFVKTTVREATGRYSVHLPFKNPRPKLGESYHLALKRFQNLEKRFGRDPVLKTEYCSLVSLFMKMNYIERVPDQKLSLSVDERFYLPHYAVTTKTVDGMPKIRIVFDAAMMSDNGVSLNDILLPGPNLQLNLLSLLTKFSVYRHVFSADVTKMYRQININESCRDYQRILWRNREGEQLVHYRVRTVVDGLCCSPFLALRTLQQLIKDEGHRYPLGAEAMTYRYMDDFFVGDNDVEKLIEKKEQLREILKCADMELSKWASNSPELVDGLSVKSEVMLSESQIVKTLGIMWDTISDCFTFNLPQCEDDIFTKRSLLSESARIFDPAGWLAPVTILIKKLFQRTWVERVGWDDPLPEDIRTAWTKIRNELSIINGIRFPRWIGEGHKFVIHGFCDASLLAYGAVVYSVVTSRNGITTARLIATKTKVAPLKPLSIARLELCGAHLLAKLLSSLLPSFREFDVSVQCWSDSTTVLAWLRGHPNRWASFVANRCSAIQELLPHASWRYIKTDQNPADVVSRGLYPTQFVKCESWWCGPKWLEEFDESAENDCSVFSTTDEQKHSINVHVASESSFVRTFIHRFSSLNRLRRVFAYMKRAITTAQDRGSGELSSNEVRDAFVQIVIAWQSERFSDEINRLRSNLPLRKSSCIVRLSPFLDDKGLLRVGGRLENSPLPFDQKHPIILDKGHLIELIVDFIHYTYYHAGTRLLISIFRSQFHAPRLRSLVKRRIRNCQLCLRIEGKTYQPVMGQLPPSRFINEKPFYSCGVDFAGPINVRPYIGKGKITLKAYVSVFVCLSSKAVHLELVHGLDTNSLILALKRFVSRRGCCDVMYSDNGKNFVGCARYITRLKEQIQNLVDDEKTQNYLAGNLMKWMFIPPHSPTFGGIWEASVKSLKYHLYRILNGKTPTTEEMLTFLSDIESILNSRPLLPFSDDPNDLRVLTPSHLVNGYPSVYVPLCGFSERKISNTVDLSRYNGLRKSINSFWRTWRNEFFNEHLKKTKWYFQGRKPKLGDLVLIKRKNELPMRWTRGRVISLIDGVDKVSRVVEVKTENGISREMVRNLVPIVEANSLNRGNMFEGMRATAMKSHCDEDGVEENV